MESDVRLSKRLTAIADMVDPAGSAAGRGGDYCLCDVGTDHAHIPIRLLLDGRIRHAIAMDVIEGPLEKARENMSATVFPDRLPSDCRTDWTHIAREKRTAL